MKTILKKIMENQHYRLYIQAFLVKLPLNLAADDGLQIRSLTCDGPTTNISTLKDLGCKFNDDFKSFKNFL